MGCSRITRDKQNGNLLQKPRIQDLSVLQEERDGHTVIRWATHEPTTESDAPWFHSRWKSKQK